MKSIIHILAIIIVAILSAFNANATTLPQDSVIVLYKNKKVVVEPKKGTNMTVVKFNDTENNDSIFVLVGYQKPSSQSIEEIMSNNLDSNSKKIFDRLKFDNSEKKKFLTTSYFRTLDIGFVSTINETENEYAINPNTIKSANINLNLISQSMNLYDHRLHLSYGINLNNYYLKYSNKQQIQALDKEGHLMTYKDSVYTYRKNRQDIRYFSVPLLLEYHSKKSDFSIAGGVEFSFFGRTHVKQKGNIDDEDFKRKNDNEIKINPQQMNLVFKIGTENYAFFAKYALTNMYSNSAYAEGNNPNQHLMSFGICVFGI
jgi:hypothetical protein